LFCCIFHTHQIAESYKKVLIFPAVYKTRSQSMQNSSVFKRVGAHTALFDQHLTPLDNSTATQMTAQNPIPRAPGLARRLAAMLYDGLLLAALWFVATALLLAASGGHLADPGRSLWLLYALRTSLLLITLLFFAGFWVHGGQTLGMRAWRLKLVSTGGGTVSWNQAFLRFAAAIPSIGLLGIGLLWVLIDRERCAVHDRLSGTRLALLAKEP
jgi:uncharacterized RDD family membrane protein YckC